MPPDGPFHINTGSAEAILEHMAAKSCHVQLTFAPNGLDWAWFAQAELGMVGQPYCCVEAWGNTPLAACQEMLRHAQSEPALTVVR